LAVAVAATRRFPVKIVADTLGVARSNLIQQIKGSSQRRGRYKREGDDEVLAAIHRKRADRKPLNLPLTRRGD